MGISEACIRRPVMTTLITASLIVFGAFAYRLLSVSALPAVDFPTIAITATLPGASPDTMAASVASPIERQLSTIAGISALTSTSALGITTITVQFDLNRNIDGAALDVQTALTVAARRLPVEMTTPPFFRKVNPGDFPVLFISLNSPTLPMSTVDEYGQTVLAQQISQLPGVAQVLVYGGQKFAVRVQADPVAAAARNISLDDIRTALAKTNSNTPVGTIAGERQNITLSASAAISKAEDYKKVVVAYRNGAPVKLDEIANVIDGVENTRIASFFNGNRSVVLAIQRQPDANTVAVVDSVKDRIPAYRAQIPASINMEVMMDRSISVRESVHDVQETLLIAIGLVVLVIFLFLRTVSATIIPALAVPISLVATCAVMYAFNFSINNMTLLALTLSVGFVVDDAIVMLENIVRHIEGGMRPFEAALKGAREIGFTIISITVSLIAVFIPVLLMGGMVGRVFREFAVTISVAIIVSGFVSLTLTPMLCARVLRTHHEGEKQNVVLRVFEAMFNSWLRGYEWSLDKVLKYKFVTLMVTLGTMVGTAYLYVVIPKGFFPVEDTGMISVTVEGPADISFRAMQERQRQIAAMIRQDPAVAYLNSTVGVGGPNATNNTGRMFVGLKPKAERGPSGPVLQRLRRTTANVVGMAVYFREIQNINLGGRISKGEFQYTMQSSETDTLYRMSDEMLERIKTIPGLRDVNSDLYIKNPEIEIEIDREKAAFYGISVDQIRQELYNAFGNRQVATIYSPINDYQVILETRPDFQADTTGLSKIYLKTNLANTSGNRADGRRRARHRHAERHVDSAERGHAARPEDRPAAGQPSGPAALGDDLVQSRSGHVARAGGGCDPQDRARFEPAALDHHRLPGQRAGVPGVAERAGHPRARRVFAAFVVLGILYESFIHPITIISGLPSAGVGALLVLILFKMELSVIAMIGIVMLVGIVKKNAIMMIDFALERRRVGVGAEAAIREACLLRFRPIMMTTFAAIFGALPIALGTGAGAELRQPLGIAVVGGLCVSQLLTLYITPVIYLYLDRIDRVLKRRLEPQLQEVEEHPRPAAVAAE